MIPAARPSMATNIAPWPCCCSSAALESRSAKALTPCDFRNGALPISDAPAIDFATHAAASRRCEVADVRLLNATLSRAAHDRGSERMFAVRFDGGSDREQLLLGNPRRGDDVRQARFAFGERARFVHDQRVHFFHPLDGRSVFDEHAGLRAATDADHDRHRRGEPERARTCDDQYRDGVDDGVRKARFRPEPDPGGKSQQRDSDDRRHKPPRYFVRETLDRRAAALRLRDHLDDLRKDGVAADALGFHEEAAGAIDGAAADFVAVRLLDWHRLAGEHRLIDVRLAVDHAAIDRHFLAGTHAQLIAALHFIERHFALLAIAKDARGRRREIEQGADRIAGAAAGAQLQHLPEQDEHGDDRRRFEIDADLSRDAEKTAETRRARA